MHDRIYGSDPDDRDAPDTNPQRGHHQRRRAATPRTISRVRTALLYVPGVVAVAVELMALYLTWNSDPLVAALTTGGSFLAGLGVTWALAFLVDRFVLAPVERRWSR